MDARTNAIRKLMQEAMVSVCACVVLETVVVVMATTTITTTASTEYTRPRRAADQCVRARVRTRVSRSNSSRYPDPFLSCLPSFRSSCSPHPPSRTNAPNPRSTPSIDPPRPICPVVYPFVRPPVRPANP
ncbi:hypothetical protein C8Q79DRAFT_961339 [Trametes meyenii]|nr:hypothetical protein C8Q79DRAFT_961339 [Trametes meyenii]